MLRTRLIACALFGASLAPFALAPVALAQQPTAEPPAAGPAAPAAEATGESAAAATAEAEEAAAFAKVREEFEASITHRTGAIEIAKGAVALTVPSGFYYLDKTDAKKVLVDAWGNPPDVAVEGMLFKDGVSALDPESWGVVLTYDESGYVSDEDASKINYDDLLRDMQSGEDEVNAERARQNYPSVKLIGWAAKPHYDARAHKVYWAKELAFGGEPVHTLNYDMRVLGRRGVLELNFVAAIDQLALVEGVSSEVLAIPAFNQGYRYEDFDSKSDKKADYGLAGLIAGGAAGGLLLAKKTGILTVLILLLKKFWFVALGGLATAGAFIRNLFSGNKTAKAAPGAPRSPSSLDAQLFPDPPPGEPPPPAASPSQGPPTA